VLVAAIVVVLPMVLDTTPKPLDGEVSIKIPSPDSSKFSSRMVPVPPSAEPRSAGGEKAATDTKSTPKFAAAVGERPADVESPAPAPKAQPAPKPQPSAAAEAPKPAAAPAATQPAGQRYAVQVVALADAEKVKAVQAQMAAAGLQSYTEVVKTAKGDVTRVRAGPYPDRAAAEKAHDQLKTLGLPGNIVVK
jgi:DedD protein